MKTISRILMLAALASAFALHAFAQDAAPSSGNACDEQAKNDLYTQYYNLKKTNKPDDQAKAFDITKQYLDKYGSCTDQYTTALKNWHDKYQQAVGGVQLQTDFINAVNANDVAKVNNLGQQLLAKNANDAETALLVAVTNYKAVATKNPAANEANTLSAVNNALALISAGQEPKDSAGKVTWAPFASKDEAVNTLNFAVASLELKTNTADARTRLVQIAQGNSKLKEEPTVYSYLAYTYEQEAAPLLEKYKTFTTQTPESDLVLANLNRVLDEVIDSYARAVAYSKDAAQKQQFITRLTELYKSRHDNKTDGLDAYVAGITSQPLLISQPITTLPTATPAATPGGDGASTTNGSTPTAAPVANPASKPATTTAPATAKPATTTTRKPPVSRNH